MNLAIIWSNHADHGYTGTNRVRPGLVRRWQSSESELREFTKVLEKRFGPMAFQHPDPKLIANVAYGERATFDAVAKHMQTVRQVVNTDIEQRHMAERMQKSLGRGVTISH